MLTDRSFITPSVPLSSYYLIVNRTELTIAETRGTYAPDHLVKSIIQGNRNFSHAETNRYQYNAASLFGTFISADPPYLMYTSSHLLYPSWIPTIMAGLSPPGLSVDQPCFRKMYAAL